MHAFKDTKGRTWTVALHVDALKRVRALAGVDLVETVTGDLWRRLLDDAVLLGEVLWAASVPDGKPLDEGGRADFLAALRGDALSEGLLALQEELLDFFPKHQRPVAARRMLDAAEMVLAEIEQARQPRPETSGASSGGSPEPSAATPAG